MHAVWRKNFGGGEVTEFLLRRLREGGILHDHNTAHRELARYGLLPSSEANSEWLLIREIKETHCFVNPSPPVLATDTHIRWAEPGGRQSYTLPDGQEIQLNDGTPPR